MTYTNLRCFFLSLIFLFLAGCGGHNDGSQSQSQVVTIDKNIAGAWTPQNPNNDAYEFYLSPSNPPFNIGLKTGRILNGGQLVDRFTWDYLPNGSIALTKVGLSCGANPLSSCPVTGSATIKAMGTSTQGTALTFVVASSSGGSAANAVLDVYTRPLADLSKMSQGEFFLKREENLTTPLQAKNSGNAISIRMEDLGPPVWLSAPIPSGSQESIAFSAGETTSIIGSDTFDVQGAGATNIPVELWYDNVSLSASANGGFILNYEIHRKVQLPNNINASQISNLGDYEKVDYAAMSFGVINTFIHGPTLNVGDKYDTLLPVGFNPNWVNVGEGNQLQFSSGTAGTISDTDFLFNGRYSESLAFNWVQGADGTLSFTFANGIQITARFVKQINGGYQVLYTLPDPVLGVYFFLHDFLQDTPVALTAQDVPGHYLFFAGPEIPADITFHSNGTVTGTVGGFWFLDANGAIVSYECKDLSGNEIPAYQDCLASFNDLTKVSFAHIRHIKIVGKSGNNLSLNYNAALYGAYFGVVNRDYFTVAQTYEWTRVGPE